MPVTATQGKPALMADRAFLAPSVIITGISGLSKTHAQKPGSSGISMLE
jgi:hypothetical protein